MLKRTILFTAVLALGTLSAHAQATQPLKIGYTNVSYLLNVMPEAKNIEADLRSYSQQLQKQLEAKAQQLETKLGEYERAAATMTDEMRQQKEQEIRKLQAEIQEFQQNAEVSYQEKQEKLIEPARERIVEAIEAVAAENNYTYIFNSDAGIGTVQILLHAPESDNVTDLVLKKMGITPPANGGN